MNTENGKTNESKKLFHEFNDKFNLKNPSKRIKPACNNNKFEISASTWNYEFDLPDGLYFITDIQDYFEYIIQNHQTIPQYKFT